MAVTIHEDLEAKRFLARHEALAYLGHWPFHAMWGGLAVVFALLELLRAGPPRAGSLAVCAIVPFLGVAFCALQFVVYRFLPAQRWEFQDSSIRLRGREFGSIRFSKLREYSVAEADGLPRYKFFGVYRPNGHRHWVLASPESQAGQAEEILARRLARRCS